MEEKTKIMLIEYMTALGIVLGLIIAGSIDSNQWFWIIKVILGITSVVFGLQTITNHIPSLIASVKKNKQPSIDASQSPKVDPPELETKMGGFIDLASGALERGLKVLDTQLMREIEEEHDEPEPLEDPEIVVDEEIISGAEEKIKDFLLKSNNKDS